MNKSTFLIIVLGAVSLTSLFTLPVFAGTYDIETSHLEPFTIDLGPEKDLHNFSRLTLHTSGSPYEIFVQYQIRNSSNNLVCVVESTNAQYYDSSLTTVYLDNHPSHKIIEKNNQTYHYVLLKDIWRVGPGDTFLSAIKHVFEDHHRDRLLSFFFATTNGCSIEIGDTVTTYWKIYYQEH